MKLLIVTRSFAPRVGGVETYLMNLCVGLCEMRRELEITVAADTPAGSFDDAALPFRVVRAPSWIGLARLMRRADVVHLAGPALMPLALAWGCNKPTLLEHSGYQSVCPNGLLLQRPGNSRCPGHFMAGRLGECARCTRAEWGLPRAATKLVAMGPRRWLSARVSANVGVSAHVTERVQLPRATTILHGVPSVGRAAPPAGIPVFAYVGRLVAEKGVAVLLRAAGLLAARGRDFAVRLVGDGPERGGLERLAESLGIAGRVSMPGFLEGAALDAALNGVLAVVMPSVCEETAGLAAIEQMMRGRAVIASDVGGLGQVVADAGLHFPAGDAEALADAMTRLLDDPGLVDALGQRARTRALERFTIERMVREHWELYRAIAARAG